MVVPVYCEASTIRPFLARIKPVLSAIGSYEILFCLDPSPDNTEVIIREEIRSDPGIGMIIFSRRFGQPAATMAGLLHCRGKACVVIDVDLQDPPELITDLYQKLLTGYDVVYARRLSREGETPVKLAVARLGYKLIHAIAEVPVPTNTGDYRIISRRVLEELRHFPEHDLFLRGLVAYVGFRQTCVNYHRHQRISGASKYNQYLGSLRIAFNGLFGYSSKPLSLMLLSGGVLALVSGSAVLVDLGWRFIQQRHLLGSSTFALLILFMGGIQLAGLGVLGEYIGRISGDMRRRPRFIVDRTVNVVPLRDLGA